MDENKEVFWDQNHCCKTCGESVEYIYSLNMNCCHFCDKEYQGVM
ncbi:hypothetical protein KLEB273_gp267 [Bacillus phage vB_BauM_KLEB27-3]|nr:hypothetical protein KLEB273_gp267 [Bacillus phage vB_BauM_KLEB27-3]